MARRRTKRAGVYVPGMKCEVKTLGMTSRGNGVICGATLLSTTLGTILPSHQPIIPGTLTGFLNGGVPGISCLAPHLVPPGQTHLRLMLTRMRDCRTATGVNRRPALQARRAARFGHADRRLFRLIDYQPVRIRRILISKNSGRITGNRLVPCQNEFRIKPI